MLMANAAAFQIRRGLFLAG